MAKLSKRLEKELEQATVRLEALKQKHDAERASMAAAEAHAVERISFLAKSVADALRFEGGPVEVEGD